MHVPFSISGDYHIAGSHSDSDRQVAAPRAQHVSQQIVMCIALGAYWFIVHHWLIHTYITTNIKHIISYHHYDGNGVSPYMSLILLPSSIIDFEFRVLSRSLFLGRRHHPARCSWLNSHSPYEYLFFAQLNVMHADERRIRRRNEIRSRVRIKISL